LRDVVMRCSPEPARAGRRRKADRATTGHRGRKRRQAAALQALARRPSARAIAERMECACLPRFAWRRQAGLPALSVGPRCGAAL